MVTLTISRFLRYLTHRSALAIIFDWPLLNAKAEIFAQSKACTSHSYLLTKPLVATSLATFPQLAAMSTAEVEPQPDNNANSAQDVQNMLAELKGENKPEAIADSTSVEKDKAGQASNDDVKVLEKHDPVESNGVKDSGDTKEEEAKEEKRADDADGDGRERSGGHRPFRGGSRGRGGGRGRGNFKSYKENIKSDFTTQQETDDPIEIRKQVSSCLVLHLHLRLTTN